MGKRWSCEYCHFFLEDENGPKCIRYAPRPVVMDFEELLEDQPKVEAHWPFVSYDDRCGEFLDISDVD